MAKLDGFTYSGGTAPVTAAITNALEGEGARASHTGSAFSEALLMGLSGGAAFGYFTFAYKGYDPQAALLTRNTFHNYGWDTITKRLGAVQDVVHSTSADKARDKLVSTLEEGRVPIVWADVHTLGYETSDYDDMWMMTPLIVGAYEPGGAATIYDRSQAPLIVDAETLDSARAKVKKDKHRLITIDLPAPPDLSAPVKDALRDCLELYDGHPPAGSGKNFGIPGFATWIERLTKSGAKESWAKVFPPGRALFAGLITAYRSGLLHWKNSDRRADRELFAAFLEEAASILNNQALLQAASLFRDSGEKWNSLGMALLPDTVPITSEARELMNRRHDAFLVEGTRAADELARCDERLKELRDESEEALADSALAERLLESTAAAVDELCEAEREALTCLRQAITE